MIPSSTQEAAPEMRKYIYDKDKNTIVLNPGLPPAYRPELDPSLGITQKEWHQFTSTVGRGKRPEDHYAGLVVAGTG